MLDSTQGHGSNLNPKTTELGISAYLRVSVETRVEPPGCAERVQRDVEENKRIFDNCASVNFRQLIHEDQAREA